MADRRESLVDRRLFEAAGGGGAATVVFNPRHWSILASTISRLGGSLLDDDDRRILAAGGAWPAARALAAEEGVALPRALEGWDDARPIVVALFEPSELSIDELIARSRERAPPVHVRHRVVIPATDGETLTRSLASIARALQCAEVPPDHARRFSDAAAVVICDDLFLVFEEGDQLVRILVAESRDDGSTMPASLTDDAEAGVVVTPALRWISEGPTVLAAHVRPAKLRAALLGHVAERAARSTAHASNDADAARYAARARADLLGAILRTSPVGAEVDDLAIGLVTSRQPTFGLVQGLTEVGVAAYDAGLAAPLPAEGPAEAPLVVRSRVNVDVMQAVAGVPMGFGGVRDPNEALERVSGCGEPCYLHLLATRVFGLGALSDRTGLLRELSEELGPIFRFVPAELEDGATMELTLDFPALARRLGGDGDARTLAAALGVAHATQFREGRTVMTLARLGDAPPRPNPAALSGEDPGPQGSATPRDEGAACAEAILLSFEGAAESGSPSALAQRRASTAEGECPSAPEELRAAIRAWMEIASETR